VLAQALQAVRPFASPSLHRVEADFMPPYHQISLETLTQALGQANRSDIQRRNQADGSQPTEHLAGNP
jgi:hypothetical protein